MKHVPFARESDRVTEVCGWCLHAFAAAFFLVMWVGLFNVASSRGFSWKEAQYAPVLFAAYLMFGFLGSAILRSVREFGLSLSVGSALVFLLLFRAIRMKPHGGDFSAWTDELSLLFIYLTLAVVGAFLMKRAGRKEWKWWIVWWIPTTLVTALLAMCAFPFGLRESIGIFFIAIVWIWYVCFRQIQKYQLSGKQGKAGNLRRMIVRTGFGIGFVLAGLLEIKTYRTLSHVARNLKEGILMRIGDAPEIVVPVEIPQEVISATRWSLIATIIAFTSLFVFVALEIHFHKTTGNCPFPDRQTNANVK